MKIVALTATAALVVFATQPALACVAGAGYEQETRDYYRATTSVYSVVAEDFRPQDPRYPSDNFTVRLKPVEAIWGKRPQTPLTLTFTAGGCNEWFLWDGDDNTSLNGKRYFVFVAPPGERNPSLLRVMPAGGRSAAEALVMLGQLQISGGQLPADEAEQQALPAEARNWSRIPQWLWLSGASIILLLTGVLIGRALRPRTKG
jgi:hypothetical protein